MGLGLAMLVSYTAVTLNHNYSVGELVVSPPVGLEPTLTLAPHRPMLRASPLRLVHTVSSTMFSNKW